MNKNVVDFLFENIKQSKRDLLKNVIGIALKPKEKNFNQEEKERINEKYLSLHGTYNPIKDTKSLNKIFKRVVCIFVEEAFLNACNELNLNPDVFSKEYKIIKNRIVLIGGNDFYQINNYQDLFKLIKKS